jgi:hypothetical protein
MRALAGVERTSPAPSLSNRARAADILRASRRCRLDPRQSGNATSGFPFAAIALPGYPE